MITGHDAPHPEARPHDHKFWKAGGCPVCNEAAEEAERQEKRRQNPVDQAACQHIDFAGSISVHRLEDTGTFVAGIRVWCSVCQLMFSFSGLPLAISTNRACVNIDATEVSLPIEPGPKPIPLGGTIPVEMPRLGES
jgi:hypothetical protein